MQSSRPIVKRQCVNTTGGKTPIFNSSLALRDIGGNVACVAASRRRGALGRIDLSEVGFTRGMVCVADEGVDLGRAIVVAEVFEQALDTGDKGLVGCYVVAHSLEVAEAESAMRFFSSQPALIVDAERLVEDAGARFPALVVIRYSDETEAFLSAMLEYDILRDLPDDDVIRPSGWDLCWALQALNEGRELPAADPLPAFDYRGLRRKVMACRAATYEDRDPWMEMEREVLRRLTRDEPEGCEKMLAEVHDLDAALSGSVDFGDTFSVVIPTLIERARQNGPIMEWVASGGREIVVAHGLDAIQAARALKVVRDDPDTFVAKSKLVSRKARETLQSAIVVRDVDLNWMATDFSGRRAAQAYEILRSRVAGLDPAATPVPERATGR